VFPVLIWKTMWPYSQSNPFETNISHENIRIQRLQCIFQSTFLPHPLQDISDVTPRSMSSATFRRKMIPPSGHRTQHVDKRLTTCHIPDDHLRQNLKSHIISPSFASLKRFNWPISTGQSPKREGEGAYSLIYGLSKFRT
jgi:hypothetical protein